MNRCDECEVLLPHDQTTTTCDECAQRLYERDIENEQEWQRQHAETY